MRGIAGAIVLLFATSLQAAPEEVLVTDYIAVDIYLQYLEAVMKVVNGSLATKDYPGANMKELKNGLSDARQALNSLRMEVQIKEDALISAQQQIRFIRQQVSSKMSDRVLGNYQFSRVN